MKKNVYSLVLSEQVIQAADREALKRGMSRSALINEILASALSYTTPEMRIRDIFCQLERMTENQQFRMQAQPTDAMLSLLGSLSYKYNPTVRYSVSLSRSTGPIIGILKISFRTQSKRFADALSDFFYLFGSLEESNAPKGVKYQAEPGRLSRRLVMPPNTSYTAKETGVAISDYIKMFDKALNAYFTNLPQNEKAFLAVTDIYADYIKHKPYKI